MFTPPNVSCVTCHMSRVTCHVSRVTCHMSLFFFQTKWWSLSVEGLLSTGPTPSSLGNGWLTDWNNDKAVCRTALATPGLSKILNLWPWSNRRGGWGVQGLVVVPLTSFFSSFSKPICLAQESSKTYFVFTPNARYHILKTYFNVYITPSPHICTKFVFNGEN